MRMDVNLAIDISMWIVAVVALSCAISLVLSNRSRNVTGSPVGSSDKTEEDVEVSDDEPTLTMLK